MRYYDDRAGRPLGILCGVLLLGVQLIGCAHVDVIRLTNETFPPKSSGADVEVLEQQPTSPHLQLAELRIADSGFSFGHLQRKILDKAAVLGADAVVFVKPESHIEHEVAYEPVYSPWGGYGPYGPGFGGGGYGGLGPGGWGYGGPGGWGYGGLGGWGATGTVAVPYDVTINSLKGTAIKYVAQMPAR